jgi:hypothetical protein
LRDVISQPLDKSVEAELVAFVEPGDEIPGFLSVGSKTRAVEPGRSAEEGAGGPVSGHAAQG